MKINKILKTISTIIFIYFVVIYLSTMNNYQSYTNKKQNILTEEAIKQFEKDVANGKKIVASNYLTEEKNYNNKISNLGLNLSNTLERLYKKTITKFFKKISNMVEE